MLWYSLEYYRIVSYVMVYGFESALSFPWVLVTLGSIGIMENKMVTTTEGMGVFGFGVDGLGCGGVGA